MNNTVEFIYFFLLLVLSLSLESLLSFFYYKITKNKYKTHHFSVSKFIYFLIFPLLITMYFVQKQTMDVFSIFIGFALFGTLAEWLIGYFYEKIVGERLWTYHRYAINKYTSVLSIPMWGLCGLIFYQFMKIFS